MLVVRLVHARTILFRRELAAFYRYKPHRERVPAALGSIGGRRSETPSFVKVDVQTRHVSMRGSASFE